MQRSWLSVHLFYAGDLNHLLHLLVAPVVAQIEAPFFFIRYWEGGPHIRLRLYVDETAEIQVKEYLEAASDRYFLQYPSQRRELAYQTPLLPNDSLQYITYVPEISRYGDERSIHLAEQQFGISAAYVLQQIKTTALNPSTSLIQAVKLNIVMLQTLQATPFETLDVCYRFVQAWLPRLYDRSKDSSQEEQYYKQLLQQRFDAYAPALTNAAVSLWQEIAEGRTTDVLQTFADGNRIIFQQYRLLGFSNRQLGDITGSFIHMGHNRLGVSNLDEAYIMYFTGKCLEHIYGITY
ncbi:thiopeptide-type bacteriocin biosynthesis protein [Chitinophaga flava]|uniref:Thiopeptide-type bacteriocin biosynthesis domain-containing protein n=1 Tax=Chitinophaga flava TaxID=2259036 RepID=A0A365XRZ7_9BACT|nr:thiopeptide-type bacteriocin biosynthesis protein [Chitinophaga flava]RBL89122.1 hypothetical protein DF182_21550 [Chitinophaga flava]